MSWIRRHPYAAVSAVAGLLLIIGALIVESRTATQPSTLSVWGGSGAPLLNPTSYTPGTIVSERPSTLGDTSVSPIYIPPRAQDSEAPAPETLDFDTFVASLVSPAGTKSVAATTSSDTGLSYSLIPRGLIATETSTRSRSPEQQALFTYGNDAGSYIQTYEDSNKNASVALRDQAEDRQNPQKMQAVKLVAAGLITAGESLLGMEDLPSSVASIHKALAQSYIESGRALSKVPDANGDDAFLAAINAYNSTADVLVKNYVALATMFPLAGVTFSTQDPGSVFMFEGGGGL